MFFSQPSEPMPAYPQKLLPDSKASFPPKSLVAILRRVDAELALSWHALRRFCALVEIATQTQKVVRLDFVSASMRSIMYRLLQMDDFAHGSLDEVIRRALLAFSFH